MNGDEIIYLESSLGPETEIPVGLVPSKETTEVLKSMFTRFEGQIVEAESKTHEVIISSDTQSIEENKVHTLKQMYYKKGLFDADPATTKSIHFLYTQLDSPPRHTNEMNRLSGSKYASKRPS